MFQLILILSFLAAIMVAGLIYKGKNESVNDYVLGNKSFSKWVIFATVSASFIGGGFSMGVAEKTALLGIGYIVVMWGFSLKEILVAKYIAPHLSSFPNVVTIGDIMATKLGLSSKILTGVLSCIVCGGVLGAQIVAIGHIFHFFLGFSLTLSILLGAGIVILYSSIGGIRAIITTDVLQFIVLAIGFPFLLIFAALKIGRDPSIDATLIQPDLLHIPSAELSVLALVSLFLTFLMGETLVPPYVQRLLIGKNSEETSKGTLWSGLFSIPFFAVAAILGLQASIIHPGSDPSQSLFLLAQSVLPIGIKSLFIAGLISAVMSTADSFLHSASVAFMHDIVKPLKKDMSDRTELIMTQIGTLLIGLLGIICALYFKNIIDLCFVAWTYWAPVMLVPLIMIIRRYPYSSKDFWIGGTLAAIAVIVWPYDQFSSLVIGVLVNVAVVACRRLFIKKAA